MSTPLSSVYPPVSFPSQFSVLPRSSPLNTTIKSSSVNVLMVSFSHEKEKMTTIVDDDSRRCDLIDS